MWFAIGPRVEAHGREEDAGPPVADSFTTARPLAGTEGAARLARRSLETGTLALS